MYWKNNSHRVTYNKSWRHVFTERLNFTCARQKKKSYFLFCTHWDCVYNDDIIRSYLYFNQMCSYLWCRGAAEEQNHTLATNQYNIISKPKIQNFVLRALYFASRWLEIEVNAFFGRDRGECLNVLNLQMEYWYNGQSVKIHGLKWLFACKEYYYFTIWNANKGDNLRLYRTEYAQRVVVVVEF